MVMENIFKKYPKGIEVIVGPFILNDKNELLLFTSPKWKNEWIVPGGHVEPGETLEDAVLRETKEEIGVDIEIVELFNISQNFVSPPEFKRNAHFIFIDFIAKLKSDQFVFNDEISEYKWFGLDEAASSSCVKKSCKKAAAKIKIWLDHKKDHLNI